MIHRVAGISLSDQKRALLVGRLSPRLRALELPTFGAYFDHVTADAAEMVRMIDAVCTNETHFFREPKQFAFLEDEVLPRWRAAADRGERRREVRVWSAGCSTGEEPYSIAMSLLARLPEWRIEIVASDLVLLARGMGWTYERLIGAILQAALERHGAGGSLTPFLRRTQ